jgi:hypothetical protein
MAEEAYRAMSKMVASAGVTMRVLRNRFARVPGRDSKRIRELIALLDSDSFAERKRASEELERLGRLATPELEEALRKPPSAEARRRLRALQVAASVEPRGQDRVQEVRVVQVLEALASTEARALLREIASGEPLAPRTQEARQALVRLEGARKGH